jgi:hypothetical protein
MESFAKKGSGRPNTPKNGQPDPERQAAAANARVHGKPGLNLQQPRVLSGLPGRGLNNAQNSSAPMQQAQWRTSGQAHGYGLKRDPYDTDAASIDTTVNQSVVQVEDSPKRDYQHQQNGHVTDLGGGSDDTEERSEYEEEEYMDFGDYVFTQEDKDFIKRAGAQNLSREEQLNILQQGERAFLRTVDGDSYPTTTNGEPSELGGGQEPPFNFHDNSGSGSPSPQRPKINSQSTRAFAPQSLQPQQQPNMSLPNHNMHQPSVIFQQAAHVREQARSSAPFSQYAGHTVQRNGVALPFGQAPIFGQTNPTIAPALHSHSTAQPNPNGQASKHSQHASRQPSGPSRAFQYQTTTTKPLVAQAPPKNPSSGRVKPDLVVQQQSDEQPPIEDVQPAPDGDYDHNTLFKMKYEDLKNEDFDTDPRAKLQVLHEEDLQKTLVERLDLAQEKLDAGQQSDFFRSLPTTEWEEAGDWFLDQFQSIIQRTKQARQTKRKLAQEFEDEVEKRHKHVSKKYHQVEQAMDKMKAQGEGMVPKSPRPSKSPMPKRG